MTWEESIQHANSYMLYDFTKAEEEYIPALASGRVIMWQWLDVADKNNIWLNNEISRLNFREKMGLVQTSSIFRRSFEILQFNSRVYGMISWDVVPSSCIPGITGVEDKQATHSLSLSLSLSLSNTGI